MIANPTARRAARARTTWPICSALKSQQMIESLQFGFVGRLKMGTAHTGSEMDGRPLPVDQRPVRTLGLAQVVPSSVKGEATAHRGHNHARTNLSHLLAQLAYQLRCRPRNCASAIRNEMYINPQNVLPSGELEEFDNIVYRTVRALVRKKSDEMKRAVPLVHSGDCLLERRGTGECPCCDGLLDPDFVLRHHPTCPDVQVPRLGISLPAW